MKKSLTILACAAVTFSISAQQTVLKEAEKAMKSGKEYTEVLSIVNPAMTNPETQNDAKTYFIPGKAGFKQYDELYGKKRFGMLGEGENIKMADAMLGGYDNFLKALSLDSVADAKGKIKTKYSKEIINTVKGHYNDFTEIGAEFYNAKRYADAYRSWDIFCQLTKNPQRFEINPVPDTIVANFMFNRALAAYLNDDMTGAAKSFHEAAENGYPKPEVYEYGIDAAIKGKAQDELFWLANRGNELYGKENVFYINNIINYFINDDKYDEAINYLEDAIKTDPSNAQYYALEGLIYDTKNDIAKSLELFKTALEKDPKNGLANYYYGRGLCLKAGQLSDDYTGNDYAKYKTDTLIPLFREGIEYLEKAYEYDKNNRVSILKALDVAYYQCDDQAGQDSVKQRKLNDE